MPIVSHAGSHMPTANVLDFATFRDAPVAFLYQAMASRTVLTPSC